MYTAIFYLSVKYVLPVLLPFLIGLSIASLVQKPAALLASRVPHLSRKVCCIIMTTSILFITGMLLCAAVCSAVGGAMDFCPGIPGHLARAKAFMMNASAASDRHGAWGQFVNLIVAGAEWCVDFFSENYTQYLPSVLRRSTAMIARLPAMVTASLFSVISALFACGEFDGIKETVKNFLPKDTARSLTWIIHTSVRTVTMLLKTYGTLMTVTFGELVLGLTVIRLLGYNTGNILTTALIIALIDILPILGTGTVMIPWGIFEIITGNAALGGLLLALFGIIGLIRNFLEPKLISGRLELHPFFTLAGVYIGGKLFGASGIVVMPLAMVILHELYTDKTANAENLAASALAVHSGKPSHLA